MSKGTGSYFAQGWVYVRHLPSNRKSQPRWTNKSGVGGLGNASERLKTRGIDVSVGGLAQVDNNFVYRA